MEIDEYLKEILKVVYDNRDSIDMTIVSTNICDNICEFYKYNGNRDVITKKIYQILSEVKNDVNIEELANTIKKDTKEIIDDLSKNSSVSSSNVTPNYSTSTSTSSSNTTTKTSSNNTTSNTQNTKTTTSGNNKTTNKNTTSSSSKTSELKTLLDSTSSNDSTIDVDTDLLGELATTYEGIKGEVNGNKLVIEGTPSSLASDLKTYVGNKDKEIVEIIEEIKLDMVNTSKEMGIIDDSTDTNVDNFSFNDIWKKTQSVKKGKLKLADANFFKKQGYTVKNNVVTIKQAGKTYTYNLKTKVLTVVTKNSKTGKTTKQSTKVNFYIPQGVDDVSKLNTFTYIITNKYNTTNNPKTAGAIIIEPVWNGKKTIIADATRFINAAAKVKKEDISSKKVQNIISGGSVYGAYSLQIAANTGSLYNTVACVNNAAIVNGINGVPGGKTKIASLADLKKLDGKNIYFVSTANDPNMYKCAIGSNAWPDKNCAITKSYLYTGLELVAKNCPNANIYMVTNNNNTKAFTTLANKYKNLNYSTSMWKKLGIDSKQTEHAYGKVVSNLMQSILAGYNYYTN